MIETTRLHIRPLLESDFPDVFRMQSDPAVMRYIRPAVDDPEVVPMTYGRMDKYCAGATGFRRICSRMESIRGLFAGYAVARHVSFDPATGEYEVGYIIAPEYWGQGVASEVTRALCAYLFQLKHPEYIVAFTAFENSASQQVLLKSGFTATGTRDIYDGGSKEFRLYHARNSQC